MTTNRIKEGIYTFRLLDWDRRLFDELIPLPDGTTYNSYFVQGSRKNALIDSTDALIKKDITVKSFNLTELDLGELAKALVDTTTIIIASPTVLKGPHPEAFYAAYLTNVLQPKARFASQKGHIYLQVC